MTKPQNSLDLIEGIFLAFEITIIGTPCNGETNLKGAEKTCNYCSIPNIPSLYQRVSHSKTSKTEIVSMPVIALISVPGSENERKVRKIDFIAP